MIISSQFLLYFDFLKNCKKIKEIHFQNINNLKKKLYTLVLCFLNMNKICKHCFFVVCSDCYMEFVRSCKFKKNEV